MNLSIIIVNHNTRDLLMACLRSVFASTTQRTFEVLVVDNASTDDSIVAVRSEFPHVTVIASEANVGFAAANNRAIRQCSGENILLLNSDTTIEPETLDIMFTYLDSQPTVGAVGCKVCLPDGSLDRACKRGFPTPWAAFAYILGLYRLLPRMAAFNSYQLSHLSADETHEVDSLSGCCMMLRREVIDRVGLLDETFFMYGEDIDWCYRIKHDGWSIHYHPATRITHFKGGSNRQRSFRVVYEFHRAMILFFRKHYAQRYWFPVRVLVYAGVAVRYLVAVVINAARRLV